MSRKTPLTMLTEIPDLAAEALQTWNHPNPGGKTDTTKRAKPGSKAPTDLAVLDALRPDPDAKGKSLRGLLMQAVWAIHEDNPLRYPELPEQTFTQLCAWLTASHAHWKDTREHGPNLKTCMTCREYGGTEGFVLHMIGTVHRELATLCRVAKDPVYRCPRCNGNMQLQPGRTYLRCDESDEHDQPADIETRYRRRSPMPASLICVEFGVTREQLRMWKHRRQLALSKLEKGEPWYWPWDVLLLANPDVAAAFKALEGTA